jgi:hypothetical protein
MKMKIKYVLVSVLGLICFAALSFGVQSENERVILSTIYFNIDSAELAPEFEQDLNKIQAMLRADPRLALKIDGFSDNQDSAQNNLKISQKRAQTVLEWFLKHGVDRSRIEVHSHGTSQTATENATLERRPHNRRVEILKVILKSPSAHFPQTGYEFSAVVEGQKITHDFVIQNKGTAPLHVQKVRTD